MLHSFTSSSVCLKGQPTSLQKPFRRKFLQIGIRSATASCRKPHVSPCVSEDVCCVCGGEVMSLGRVSALRGFQLKLNAVGRKGPVSYLHTCTLNPELAHRALIDHRLCLLCVCLVRKWENVFHATSVLALPPHKWTQKLSYTIPRPVMIPIRASTYLHLAVRPPNSVK